MEIIFNSFNTIAVLGILQGLVAAIYLLFQNGNKLLKLFLFILLFSLVNILITNTLNEILQREQTPNVFWHFNWAVALGPSLYLYVITYLKKEARRLIGYTILLLFY